MVDAKLAQHQANKTREKLGLGQGPIANIFSVLEDAGIILFKKPFSDSALSAIFMKDSRNHLVVINSNRTLGHQYFSAAHELYHYFYDNQLLGGICSANNNRIKNEHEQMADVFASNFLMPDDGIMAVAEKRKDKQGCLSLFDVVFLQQYFKVSWKAMLLKLHNLGYIDKDAYWHLGIRKITKALNYDPTLVAITNDTYVSNKYVELVCKAYDNDELSTKKAEEYLNDVSLSLEQLQIESDEGGAEDYE